MKLLATQAEDADNAHPSVQIEEAEAIAPLKLATPTEAHDAKPSVESDGAPALAEPQADEPQAGVQGSALVAASECSDAQIATSEAARRGVYSVKPQSKATALHTFWTAEGKYALQLESLAQLLYEQRFAKAKEEGLPIPEEPMTQLPRDQRKAIRRLASHPALMQVGRFLQRRFDSARQEGIGAFESLPLDPATLSESDQRLLQSVRSNAQRRIFLDYLHARGNALLIGDSIPTEPVTSLSSTERKRLFKMISDVRSIAELMTIND